MAKQSDAITGLSLREVVHLQALEGNPLDAEEVAMFEMFEREGWSPEKCLDHIRERARQRQSLHAAE